MSHIKKRLMTKINKSQVNASLLTHYTRKYGKTTSSLDILINVFSPESLLTTTVVSSSAGAGNNIVILGTGQIVLF